MRHSMIAFWRSASLAGALTLSLAQLAHAEDVDELADKMERIERDLRQLKYDVYKGNPPAPGEGALAGGAMAAGGGTRLNDVESSLRDLRGQVETLTYQVRPTDRAPLPPGLPLALPGFDSPGEVPAGSRLSPISLHRGRLPRQVTVHGRWCAICRRCLLEILES